MALPKPFNTLELDNGEEHRIIFNNVRKRRDRYADLMLSFVDKAAQVCDVLLSKTDCEGGKVLTLFGALQVLGVTDIDKLKRLYGYNKHLVTLDKSLLLRLGYTGTHYEELKLACMGHLNKHARMYVERRSANSKYWLPTVSLYELEDALYEGKEGEQRRALLKVVRFFIPVYTRYVQKFVVMMKRNATKKKGKKRTYASHIEDFTRYTNALLKENEELRMENEVLKKMIRRGNGCEADGKKGKW